MKTWQEELITDAEVYEILNKPLEEFDVYMCDLIEFYREHPIEAVYDVLGLKLTEFQKVIFIEAWEAKNIYLCQSRGSGKSFLMAIFAALWVILYPNETLLMLGPSYRQSLMLFDKIMTEVYNKSFSFKYEIINNGTKRGTMDASITMLNNSKIKFLPIGDGNKIRGERATFIMLDEHAQHDKVMIDRVIMPMLAADLNYDPENPKEGYQAKVILATSAYFQFNHAYKTFQTHLHRMEFDKDYYACVVPYTIPLEVGLYNQKFVESQRREMSMDDFEMEMGCKWINGNESAFIGAETWDKFIKYDDALEPMFEGRRDKDYIILCDVARSEGGDNTSLLVCEIRNDKLAVVRQIALNGYTYQDIRDEIRGLLCNFNVVKMFLDKFGGGTAVADLLNEEWLDYSTGIVHPPILEEDKNDSDGIKLIRFIVANSELNHRMGHATKKNIEQGKFIFPKLMDRHEEKEIEMAYLDLIALKKEVTNIQAIPSGNFHKFQQPKGNKLKRDRWTTFCYASLYIEDELNKEDEGLFFLEII